MKCAIAGAGIGGLTAAIALTQAGHEVDVYEKIGRFARVGADLQLAPNIVRTLDGLGLRDAIEDKAARTRFRESRAWDTGELLASMAMADDSEAKYGAPQLMIHRADLLDILKSEIASESLHLGSTVIDVQAVDEDVFGFVLVDGTHIDADVLIGADGIHSRVREWMHGPEEPRFTGMVSFRSIIDASTVSGHHALDGFTKWWGPEPSRVLVTYPLTRDGSEFFVFGTCGITNWSEESWTLEGDPAEFHGIFSDFEPAARDLVNACTSVLKNALYDRDPLGAWVRGNVALLGDACHPMLPFMAQGAGSAIEDAVVLQRCIAGPWRNVPSALKSYQCTRLPRTTTIQQGSRMNDWFKDQPRDVDWVYTYDAWNVPIDTD